MRSLWNRICMAAESTWRGIKKLCSYIGSGVKAVLEFTADIVFNVPCVIVVGVLFITLGPVAAILLPMVETAVAYNIAAALAGSFLYVVVGFFYQSGKVLTGVHKAHGGLGNLSSHIDKTLDKILNEMNNKKGLTIIQ